MQGSRITSFRQYLVTRRYHGGRGSDAGWAFVTHALGETNFPDATSWYELRTYLVQSGGGQPMIEAAKIVWGSYFSLVRKRRRSETSDAFGRPGVTASRAASPATEKPRRQACPFPAE